MESSREIVMIFEFQIQPGKEADFEALVPEMVASTREEAGAMGYEVFKDADGHTRLVYERYCDSDAAIAHMGLFGQRFGDRFMGAIVPGRFQLLGPASAQLRDLMSSLQAQIMSPLDGFVR